MLDHLRKHHYWPSEKPINLVFLINFENNFYISYFGGWCPVPLLAWGRRTYPVKCAPREKLSIWEKDCRLVVVMQGKRHFMGLDLLWLSGIASGPGGSRIILS